MQQVHFLAGRGLGVNPDFDRADLNRFADQGFERVGIDQYIGAAGMPGQIDAELLHNNLPLSSGQQCQTSPDGEAMIPLKTVVAVSVGLIRFDHRSPMHTARGNGEYIAVERMMHV